MIGLYSRINYLIDSLDGNGYFTGSIAEAARICQVELREAEYCLNQLRCMEPRGIFAANLKECLLNQLKAQEPPDDILLHLRPLEREMKTACIRRA